MAEARKGRPPRYTEAQLSGALDMIEADGREPTPEAVRQALCDRYGLSQGINAQSLGAAVDRALADRAEERTGRLIDSLPRSSKTAAADIGKIVTDRVVAHLAQSFHDLEMATDERLNAVREDLACYRTRCRELEARLEDNQAQLAQSDDEKADLRGQLRTAEKEIAALRDEIAAFRSEGDLRAQMLTMLREALEERDRSAA